MNRPESLKKLKNLKSLKSLKALKKQEISAELKSLSRGLLKTKGKLKPVPEKKLYVCDFCGGKFLNTRIESCGRLRADQVFDKDSGESLGGDYLVRPASPAEALAYRAAHHSGHAQKPTGSLPVLPGNGVVMVIITGQDGPSEL